MLKKLLVLIAIVAGLVLLAGKAIDRGQANNAAVIEAIGR